MKNPIYLFFLILLIAVCPCNSQEKSDNEPKGAILPITFVDIAGPRPTISYSINGKPATSMIHSNAGMYIQLSPENAQYFGIADLTEAGTYGISEPGKVNTSYKGVIRELKIENLIYTHINVSVFSKYPPDKEGFGMLGRSWIEENRIILDYQNNAVAVQPNTYQQDSIAKNLLKNGYISIPMELVGNQYYTEVSINGEKAKFSINTVARLSIDSVFAVRAKVEQGTVAGTYGGPSGKTGNIYNVEEGFKIKIGEF